MNSRERAIIAMEFGQPDRVPRYWQNFWQRFTVKWQAATGQDDPHAYFGDDMRVVAAVEAAWPSKAGIVEKQGNTALIRSGWGELKRIPWSETSTAREFMGETIEPAITERVDPDSLVFEDPKLNSRYEAAGKLAAKWKHDQFVWCKTGGPYLRLAFMRGDEKLWYDVIDDPQWVRAMVDRITDHITIVGLEQLRRYDLYETGIGIFDDVAANWGPFVGPDLYEQIFLPALRRMVKAYKDAGARWVLHHADGNVLPLLDMWIDAGIDAINPVERRSGMDPLKIREKYGRKLVCIGGLDNCEILPRGDRAEVRDHILQTLQAGREGGLIIGPHSIGPDISVETMQYVLELLEENSDYPIDPPPST